MALYMSFEKMLNLMTMGHYQSLLKQIASKMYAL